MKCFITHGGKIDYCFDVCQVADVNKLTKMYIKLHLSIIFFTLYLNVFIILYNPEILFFYDLVLKSNKKVKIVISNIKNIITAIVEQRDKTV